MCCLLLFVRLPFSSRCNELPEVHINLNVWLPLGTTASFWASPHEVTDHGPLGPVSRWAVLSDRAFVFRLLESKVSETLLAKHKEERN